MSRTSAMTSLARASLSPPALARPLWTGSPALLWQKKSFLARSSSSSTQSASDATSPLVVVSNLVTHNTGHIRVLELNRPGARNAISRALLAALRREIEDVAGQYDMVGNELPPATGGGGRAKEGAIGPTRALVLASAVDSCFCAGADLKERRTFDAEQTNAFLADLRSTFSLLSTLPIPTIAAVSSLALGGGLELALSTHLRVFTSNAVVGLPETRLGIIPGAGGTYRLPMLIGIGRARDLILTGRRVSAPEAYFLGLADRLVEVAEAPHENDVPDEKSAEAKKEKKEFLETARRAALSEAVQLAGEICHGGPIAVRAALRAVQYPEESMENRMYDRVVATADRDEALRAFAEKRKPNFQGR